MEGTLMRPFQTAVLPEWVDYNSHLTEGAYGRLFADATDHALIELGFGPEYRAKTGGTFYTVETHIRFLQGVREGALLQIESQVLGVDAKRLHLWHVMRTTDVQDPVATQESMLIHVDIASGSVTAMGESIRLMAADQMMSVIPIEAGRSIASLLH
jgi:acyl-CoA thioesterase FadM